MKKLSPTYELISKEKRWESDNYSGFQRDSFFEFIKDGTDFDAGKGWKFHISINKEDVAAAFNICAEILTRKKVGFFKVIEPGSIDYFSDPKNTQGGKHITIYDCGEKINWQILFKNIEEALLKNGIKPGCEVYNDLKHSDFVYYRNQTDLNNGFVYEITAPNPFNKPSPFRTPIPDIVQSQTDSLKIKSLTITST